MQEATESEVSTALHKAASALRSASDMLGRLGTEEGRNKAIEADNAACICINWVEGMRRDRENGED